MVATLIDVWERKWSPNVTVDGVLKNSKILKLKLKKKQIKNNNNKSKHLK